MKKKFFNLAVILATAMFGSAVFTSCDKDDDDNDGEGTEQDIIDDLEDIENEEDTQNGEEQIIKSESLNVVENGIYAAYNSSIDGGALKFYVKEVSGTAGSKVVKFLVELKGDEANGKIFELGDDADHTSYFGRINGKLQACKQKTAADPINAKNIIFALSSDADNYLITSATVNAQVRAAGATMTQFGTYVK